MSTNEKSPQSVEQYELEKYKKAVSELVDFFERQLTANEHGMQISECILKDIKLDAINLTAYLNAKETLSFHKGQKKANGEALWKLKDLGLR